MRQALLQRVAHVQVFDADDDSWQLDMGAPCETKGVW